MKERMKRKKWIMPFTVLFFGMCMSVANAFSATALTSNVQAMVTGNVVADDGVALPGVSVSIKGTDKGVVADFDGNFEIMVPDGDAVLVFSYIGYTTNEVSVGNQSVINVVLQEDVSKLDEVVVIGYGTQKKSDVTGAVASVRTEELTAFPIQSAEQALQGRAAGVNISANNGGEPGGELKIRVRGATSINANSSPLIVVDGFVDGVIPPPEDIASIDILKDASAAAIYGSRAASGVVLVTTKKGKKGKITVEVNSSLSAQEVINRLDLMNADQFGQYVSQLTNAPYEQGPANTDWQDLIFQTGFFSNQQASVSGGSENIDFYISGTYLDQKGAVINSDFERFSFLSSVNFKASDKFKGGMNLFGRFSSTNGISTQTGSGGAGGADAISSAHRFAPDRSIFNEQGGFQVNTVGDPIDNPFAIATERVNETINDLMRANLFGEYQFFDGLRFRSTLGYRTINQRTGIFIPSTLVGASGFGGEARIETSRNTNLLNENYFTYDTSLGELSSLTLTAGFSYQNEVNENLFTGARDFVSESVSFRNLSTGNTQLVPRSSITEIERESVYGRLQLNLSEKYLFTATARYDGSSNFSRNNKWAFFPSAALAWNMGKEDFLSESNTISNWKWRVSYGVLGNPTSPAYGTLARYDGRYYAIGASTSNAVAPANLANDDLKWESSYQLNVGMDVGLLDNRINLSLEYYNIDTEDLIFDQPINPLAGIEGGTQTRNIGEMNNTGVEFSLNSTNIATDDFTWNTDFNISTNINEVVSLNEGQDVFYSSAPAHLLIDQTQVLREGEAVGSFWGFIYDGVYQGGAVPEGSVVIPRDRDAGPQAGDILYRDTNGRDDNGDLTGQPDGQLNTDDRTVIGDPNPDFIMGLNNSITYKGLDLNFFFQAAVGGDILNYTFMELASGSANGTTDLLNAWTPTNTDTDIPAAAFRPAEVSNRFVYDGSYVRLKNLSLGYSFPERLLENVGLQKLRVFISGQNLLTFTDYPGGDPETNYRSSGSGSQSNTNLGLDYGVYPNVKSYTLGVNLKF
ncbi:SusC/RagA family TonB-linked outer membrane protein [Maribacter sp. 2-571]|uniref:SusC/RagA family TonB-linked outer membrane protein n=1 Tax=Maribacter sp. 2-571 TaxID=3417569 RepID=UPI003D358F24